MFDVPSRGGRVAGALRLPVVSTDNNDFAFAESVQERLKSGGQRASSNLAKVRQASRAVPEQPPGRAIRPR
ncbi:MAG: hypothetical protein MI757_16895, partial [Pirellulales bacterium]|nr:hypothetical protein [Pirellulales bacterium]